MNDNPIQPRTTPARQRPGRGKPKGGGQKAYASENDAALSASLCHGTPQTPDKPAPGVPATATSQVTQSNVKQRNHSKPKAKHLPVSPESGHPTSQTPPPRSVSLRPGTAPAFAGATFHASPAPSSLPIPSFLSKPPTQSPKPAENPIQQPSPPATDTDAPTPRQVSAPPHPPESLRESPLDFMFRAHRQERDRQRIDTPTGLRQQVPNPTSPFSDSYRASAGPQSRRPDMKRSASGIDSAELDGASGQAMGPAFSTPYQDRIRAARPVAARPAVDQTTQRKPDPSNSVDQTEALKKFLFGNNASSGGAAPSTGGTIRAGASESFSNVTPSSRHDAPRQDRPENIRAMENDLRRILKMDTAPEPPSSGQRFVSQ